MYLCYIDESGTPQIPGTTSHYVLSGIALPIWHWKSAEIQINEIKKKYVCENCEIHAGWILRSFIEQTKIPEFEKLTYDQRRTEVERFRRIELLKLQKNSKKSHLKQIKKIINKPSHIFILQEEKEIISLRKLPRL